MLEFSPNYVLEKIAQNLTKIIPHKNGENLSQKLSPQKNGENHSQNDPPKNW